MKNPEDFYCAARSEILAEYRAMCAKTPGSLLEKVPTAKSGFWSKLLPDNADAVKSMFGTVLESEYLRQLVNSDIVKTAAQGALVGAVIAVPIPIIGPAFGGAVGALVTTSGYIMKSKNK